jgi:Uma2 family endonuclease
MVKHIEDEVQYYYDTHPTEEDLMGEAIGHSKLVHYLIEVLRWHFRAEVCAICDNLNFYQTSDPYEFPIIPDIAVIKGVSLPSQKTKSWRVGKTGPAPHVVFEVASEETWERDIKEKPHSYARMGVQEYYLFDPNDPPFWKKRYPRLIGWHLDQKREEMVQMTADSQGRLWSPHLDSWLVPDGEYLRLYDRDNQRRLTEAEAEARRAEMYAKRAELLAEKLRALGVNPDEL